MTDYESFACRCTPESSQKCDDTKKWAYEYLSNPKYPEHACTDSNFASKFFYCMYGEYMVSPEFMADQWGALSTSNDFASDEYFEYHDLDKEKGTFSSYIQCDHVEDGMAYTLKAWVDYYGKYGEGQ